MTPVVHVRAATAADAYALWLWANDAETRSASFGRPMVEWRQHVEWFEARLADPMALVLVGSDEGGQPIGSVRFDTNDAWASARLSYVVAPEARGRGLARPLVAAGVRALCRSFPTIRIRAEVMPDNARSLRVFRPPEWQEQEGGDGPRQFWTQCPGEGDR